MDNLTEPLAGAEVFMKENFDIRTPDGMRFLDTGMPRRIADGVL